MVQPQAHRNGMLACSTAARKAPKISSTDAFVRNVLLGMQLPSTRTNMPAVVLNAPSTPSAQITPQLEI
jgi:hypothetical protein